MQGPESPYAPQACFHFLAGDDYLHRHILPTRGQRLAVRRDGREVDRLQMTRQRLAGHAGGGVPALHGFVGHELTPITPFKHAHEA
jgi:hypothetical protein